MKTEVESLKTQNALLYRYWLERSWSDLPHVGFVMLNPHRADAMTNDPTIRRCVGFAKSWGYGGLEVVNLFAYRAKTPSLLKQVEDPIGVENDPLRVTRRDRFIIRCDAASRDDRARLGKLGGACRGAIGL